MLCLLLFCSPPTNTLLLIHTDTSTTSQLCHKMSAGRAHMLSCVVLVSSFLHTLFAQEITKDEPSSQNMKFLDAVLHDRCALCLCLLCCTSCLSLLCIKYVPYFVCIMSVPSCCAVCLSLLCIVYVPSLMCNVSVFAVHCVCLCCARFLCLQWIVSMPSLLYIVLLSAVHRVCALSPTSSARPGNHRGTRQQILSSTSFRTRGRSENGFRRSKKVVCGEDQRHLIVRDLRQR